MNEFSELLEFVKQNYPVYAYVIQPDEEIAVDGLIFRPNSTGGFKFLNENGEQVVTFNEAVGVLRDDLAESS